ncbi:uncharacterized protein SCHCODRAFT_02225321 [Schizophyllum commune H4-8]|uniref:uncharacterized protein n=1 Tax=Schizophyllum commune (strain H4-8 / FGSC 9210) TaxID=578458 RepID=UPI00215E4217|nr:uncharacterized protein SCHCODRAFT_02225321 [Schizophyllum commune H4-8]KAI5895207.1 hypothetical protein SCHCODRAFT_02225321 [Schizophyllum commune H4-8]
MSVGRPRHRWTVRLSDKPSNGGSDDLSAVWSTTPRVWSSTDSRSRARAASPQRRKPQAPTERGNTSSAMYHGSRLKARARPTNDKS